MTFNVDDIEVVPAPYIERTKEEFKLHVAIVSHLTGKIKKGKETIKGTPAFRGLFVTHIFSGRSAEDGFFLKMMGLFPGIADLLLLWRGQCECGRRKVGIGFIEIKKSSGVQSGVQKKFQGICIWLGISYEIVRSVRETHQVCVKWGLIPEHNAIKEPDLRSETQKKLDNHNMYKR